MNDCFEDRLKRTLATRKTFSWLFHGPVGPLRGNLFGHYGKQLRRR